VPTRGAEKNVAEAVRVTVPLSFEAAIVTLSSTSLKNGCSSCVPSSARER
jgi:hypothetical protein